MLKLIPPGTRHAGPSYYAYGKVRGHAKPIERSLRTANRREAERRLRELVAQLEAEPRHSQSQAPAGAAEAEILNFADAIDSYIEAKSPRGYSPTYLARLKSDRIGIKPLADITPGDILKAAHRLHPGCADATKDRNVIVPASAVLHYAYHEQLRTDWVKVPKLDKSKPRNRRPRPGSSSACLLPLRANSTNSYSFLLRRVGGSPKPAICAGSTSTSSDPKRGNYFWDVSSQAAAGCASRLEAERRRMPVAHEGYAAGT